MTTRSAELPTGDAGAARPARVRADVHPLAEGHSLVVTPRGELFRVATPPNRLEAFLAALDGTRTVEEALAAADAGAELAEIPGVLLAEGCLATEPGPRAADWSRFAPAGQPSDKPPPIARLLLTGDAALVDALSPLLDPALPAATHLGVPAEPAELLARITDPAATLVVVARTQLDASWLLAWDQAAQDAGVRWTQFHLDAGQAYFGPAILPGRTANYHDLLARRRCAIDEEEVFDALIAPPLGDVYLPPAPELSWMLGAFAADLDRLVAGLPCRTLSTEVEADPVRMNLVAHPVLPLPDRQLTGPLTISGERDTSLLVSPRTGIIQRVRDIAHDPAVPDRLHTAQTHNSSMGRIDPDWANDVICGGSVFDDAQAARDCAVGEAVERYCGNYMKQNELRWASYHELLAAGEHAVDPDRLVLYSQSLYDAPGFPFVPFTRDLPVRWVRGRSLTHDRPVWLPVTLVYVNWIAGERGGGLGPTSGVAHPVTNYMNFSGVSAGRTLEQALVSGIEELVERDATMIWWMNRQPLPALALTPDLDGIWQGRPSGLGQRATLIPIDNEFGIPVVAGIVHNTVHDWFTIGFAARPDIRQAGLKAWTEALTLQEGSRDLDTEHSLIRQAVAWGFASYQGLKPWRADRRYLDDYRPDFRDCADLMCQQQIFLDPRAIDAVLPWTAVPATREIDTIPTLPDRSLATYRDRVESRGFEICYVDLTTPDVAATGMHATRVLIPGLVPNFPAAFPMLGTDRIQQTPVDLGWRDTPLAEHELNYWPIPHA
ncbi:YcaO-like family protein [Frankia sp. CNm7]|uniref:YcaO-like family protein n=1 Tax=Frankia nepalensis TaxID=1836974 RepID=A0A937RG25_9ACTN|nr:YcaO-like family protein [Frankia nepalensis]MBL7499671.1 YcaO-like family protein [Frankia nepalensis]MBL7514643.1 YcaO-like family protein [Frankia nepalensis]MBL7522610.1 YcaO-like family protein [Frankia nepalensis]MBL7629397.1 YcaO-like family protein [Frankia nepalensis]